MRLLIEVSGGNVISVRTDNFDIDVDVEVVDYDNGDKTPDLSGFKVGCSAEAENKLDEMFAKAFREYRSDG